MKVDSAPCYSAAPRLTESHSETLWLQVTECAESERFKVAVYFVVPDDETGLEVIDCGFDPYVPRSTETGSSEQIAHVEYYAVPRLSKALRIVRPLSRY